VAAGDSLRGAGRHRFIPDGAAATVVALTDSGWDRRADGAAASLSYDSGWEVVLGAYGSTAAT
jgi:hypothetical protein